MQSVYSTVPADCAIFWYGVTLHCRIAVYSKGKYVWHFLFTKVYTSLFLSKGVKAFVISDRQTETNGDGGRQRQTVILIHNFFSWLYHALLSSRPYLELLLLLGWGGGYSTGDSLWAAAPVGRPATRWRSRNWPLFSSRILRLT